MAKYWIFLSLITFGCRKEVSIDFPERIPVPVVNGIFATDSLLTVSLGLTRPILNDNEGVIETAQGILYQNGSILDTLTYKDGVLFSNILAEANNKYRIVIDIPGYETLVADDEMFEDPKILTASYTDSVYIGDEGDVFSQASIKFDDSRGTQDYYELRLYLKALVPKNELYENTSYDPSKSELFFDILINDIVLKNEGLLNYLPETLVFSDELFDGQQYDMKINFRPFNSSLYFENPPESVVLIMEMRKVSRNYYEYSKTLTRHFENQFSDIWDGVTEPAPVFSNVENGYGIFAGYSKVKDTIIKN